jgi:hypothetical protein
MDDHPKGAKSSMKSCPTPPGQNALFVPPVPPGQRPGQDQAVSLEKSLSHPGQTPRQNLTLSHCPTFSLSKREGEGQEAGTGKNNLPPNLARRGSGNESKPSKGKLRDSRCLHCQPLPVAENGFEEAHELRSETCSRALVPNRGRRWKARLRFERHVYRGGRGMRVLV